MIPAPPGLSARYKHEGPRPYWTRRRVVAFDDDWQPLVITDDHRLELASRYSNFDGITDHADPDRHDVTAIMPAGGWRIEYTNADGSKWSEPLAAWGLMGGEVVPLTTDCDGVVMSLDGFTGKYRVYHPDATEEPPVTAAQPGSGVSSEEE